MNVNEMRGSGAALPQPRPALPQLQNSSGVMHRAPSNAAAPSLNLTPEALQILYGIFAQQAQTGQASSLPLLPQLPAPWSRPPLPPNAAQLQNSSVSMQPHSLPLFLPAMRPNTITSGSAGGSAPSNGLSQLSMRYSQVPGASSRGRPQAAVGILPQSLQPPLARPQIFYPVGQLQPQPQPSRQPAVSNAAQRPRKAVAPRKDSSQRNKMAKMSGPSAAALLSTEGIVNKVAGPPARSKLLTAQPIRPSSPQGDLFQASGTVHHLAASQLPPNQPETHSPQQIVIS